MVETQSINLLHKEQRRGATIPKHNRIFMDIYTLYYGTLQQSLNTECPIPSECQLFHCSEKGILGTFPYGSLPLSNPCGKSFCCRRSKQHLYSPILENVQLIWNPNNPKAPVYTDTRGNLSIQIPEIPQTSIEL